MNPEIKNCQNCKKDFTIESEDFKFYKKIKVPAPTFCPECRAQRRMLFRNERVFFKTACDLCKKNIISMYNPNDKFKVFCDKCWWGDGWDAKVYQSSYDWQESFFLQWTKLLKQVPLIHTWRFNNINSEYMNYGTENKNCYLSYSILYNENVSYSYSIDKSQDTIDSL